MKKKFPSLILLIVIIMFSFPWVMVSCAGQPIAKATGFQIAFGSYQMNNLGSDINVPSFGGNFWIILALILLVIGTLVGFWVKEEFAHKILAGISTVVSTIFVLFLIIIPSSFYRSLNSSYNSSGLEGSDELLNGIGQIIKLSFQPAFYISLILTISAAILSFYRLKETRTEKETIIKQGNNESTSSDINSEFIFCPNCGAQNFATNKFCSKCGFKLKRRG